MFGKVYHMKKGRYVTFFCGHPMHSCNHIACNAGLMKLFCDNGMGQLIKVIDTKANKQLAAFREVDSVTGETLSEFGDLSTVGSEGSFMTDPEGIVIESNDPNFPVGSHVDRDGHGQDDDDCLDDDMDERDRHVGYGDMPESISNRMRRFDF